MTNERMEAEDREEVANLASRAKKLISRRSLIASTGSRLVLPVLATFLISRDAMAMSGSGQSAMMMSGGGSNAQGDDFDPGQQ